MTEFERESPQPIGMPSDIVLPDPPPVFDDRGQISFVPFQPHAINATGKKCHDRCANRCDDNISENHHSPPW
jgi:hypothetical protein